MTTTNPEIPYETYFRSTLPWRADESYVVSVPHPETQASSGMRAHDQNVMAKCDGIRRDERATMIAHCVTKYYEQREQLTRVRLVLAAMCREVRRAGDPAADDRAPIEAMLRTVAYDLRMWQGLGREARAQDERMRMRLRQMLDVRDVDNGRSLEALLDDVDLDLNAEFERAQMAEERVATWMQRGSQAESAIERMYEDVRLLRQALMSCRDGSPPADLHEVLVRTADPHGDLPDVCVHCARCGRPTLAPPDHDDERDEVHCRQCVSIVDAEYAQGQAEVALEHARADLAGANARILELKAEIGRLERRENILEEVVGQRDRNLAEMEALMKAEAERHEQRESTAKGAVDVARERIAELEEVVARQSASIVDASARLEAHARGAQQICARHDALEQLARLLGEMLDRELELGLFHCLQLRRALEDLPAPGKDARSIERAQTAEGQPEQLSKALKEQKTIAEIARRAIRDVTEEDPSEDGTDTGYGALALVRTLASLVRHGEATIGWPTCERCCRPTRPTLDGPHNEEYCSSCRQTIELQRVLDDERKEGHAQIEALTNVVSSLTVDRAALHARVQELLDHNSMLRDRARDRPSVHVRQFHQIFGHLTERTPTIPSEATVRRRVLLVTEEYLEYLTACGYDPQDLPGRELLNRLRKVLIHVHRYDLAAVVREKTDLVYQLEGGLVECGVDGDPPARLVHEANLKKLWPCDGCAGRGDGCATCRGAGGTVRLDAMGKVAKPPTWHEPDIRGELIRQGWRP